MKGSFLFTKRLAGLALAFLLLFSLPLAQAASQSEDYELAMDYFYGENGRSQNYQTASILLSALVIDGYAPAQSALAYMHYHGLSVEASLAKAVGLFELAAGQEDPFGMNWLGKLYENGEGLPQDDEKALFWVKKSAEAGYVPSIFLMGDYYLEGRVVQQDYQQAMAWYQKGAKLNDSGSLTSLGYMYETGLGTAPDLEKAISYYQQAVQLEEPTAMSNLARLYELGQGLPKDLDKALELYRQAADLGNATAAESLAWLYVNDPGQPQDAQQAAALYQRALELYLSGKTSPKDAYRVGLIYDMGYAGSSDYKEAMAWYLKAAQGQYQSAYYALGRLHEAGLGTPVDMAQALAWYQQGALASDGQAYERLAYFAIEGIQMEKNPDQAKKWLETSLELGNENALMLMQEYNLE